MITRFTSFLNTVIAQQTNKGKIVSIKENFEETVTNQEADDNF
jgi:hypothetical protein